ncbi:hypothetical protein [Sphingomonas sp.]|uniref:CBU_0592 family membrane protein n=1 Tax=Sphingomonas sp. TaxID=28214 RepID=UPI0035BBE648
MNLGVEAAGWAGSALVLAAYLLVTIKRLSPESAVFQAMNMAGGVGLTVNAIWHGAMTPAFLDAAWALIGLAALVRLYWTKRASS